MNVGTVGALARLQLEARRLGLELRVLHASPELEEVIAFVGLDGVLLVQPRRQSEQRKKSLGVEEERQLDDPSA